MKEVSARKIAVDVKLFLNCIFSALGFFFYLHFVKELITRELCTHPESLVLH